MKRKVGILLALVMVIGLCSGCGIVHKVKIDKKGNAKTCDEIYLTGEEAAEDTTGTAINGVDLSEENYKGSKKVDGVTYEVYAGKWEKMDTSSSDDENVDKYVSYSKNKFIMDIPASKEATMEADESGMTDGMMNSMLSSYDFYKIKVTFPKKITKTNGKLSKDKKSVTFDFKDAYANNVKLYAYTNK